MAEITASTPHVALPDQPPPASEVGVVGWLRRNLFSSIPNTVLTLFALYLLYAVVPPLLNWAIFSANWQSGTSVKDCVWDGACWTMIRARFGILMYGFYPAEARWREAQSALTAAHRALVDQVRTLEDAHLDEPSVGTLSRYVLLHGVVQHDLYHAGQIAILKKLARAPQ